MNADVKRKIRERFCPTDPPSLGRVPKSFPVWRWFRFKIKPVEGIVTSERKPFGVGLFVCWASLLSLPLGMMAIGGGPCAGPRDSVGSIILLLSGIGGMTAAGFGVYRVARGFRQSLPGARAFGVLAALAACLAAIVGVVYIWIGVLSLQVYLRM